jgi:uncharacterized peroxidase-related enzyme
MSRITVVNPSTATGAAKTLLDSVQAKLGVTPNFLRVLANSPVALESFLGLHSIAGNGKLDLQTRERIAVALAQQNNCEYCLSAHSYIGRKAGLTGDEIAANRQGTSHDAKASAAVAFARALVENTGEVTNAQLDAVRKVGYGDAEVVEIIVHVGMNLLTNILNKAARVDIDFPKVELNKAA